MPALTGGSRSAGRGRGRGSSGGRRNLPTQDDYDAEDEFERVAMEVELEEKGGNVVPVAPSLPQEMQYGALTEDLCSDSRSVLLHTMM